LEVKEMILKKLGFKLLAASLMITIFVGTLASCNLFHKHSWIEASCIAPKTCSVCAITEGEIIEHSMVNSVCKVCGYEDPIYKERKTGEAIFDELLSIGAAAERIANYVDDAWYFYIYESNDIGIHSDGMSEFAGATGLSKANVEKATIEYLTILGYAEDEIDTTFKNFVFFTLSGCLYVATRSCELMGLNDGVEASLDDIKSQLKTMSDEYENETGLSILKDMYSNVSNYYEYVMSPSGNYNQFNDKVDNYTDKIVENIDDLNFIYD
jgi:hypothetical protein